MLVGGQHCGSNVPWLRLEELLLFWRAQMKYCPTVHARTVLRTRICWEKYWWKQEATKRLVSKLGMRYQGIAYLLTYFVSSMKNDLGEDADIVLEKYLLSNYC